MSKDRLVIDEDRDGKYRIAWFIAEEQETGAALGEHPELLDQREPPADRDAWEAWTAENAVASMKSEHDGAGYYWESRSAANDAIRQIREALKQERPLPDWARTALAEGWKPPKGWRA